jgi:hypothetical protein
MHFVKQFNDKLKDLAYNWNFYCIDHQTAITFITGGDNFYQPVTTVTTADIKSVQVTFLT